MPWTNREPTYVFDHHSQREVLTDRLATELHVETLKHRGFTGDSIRVVWLRILGRLDEATQLGWAVLARLGGPCSPEMVGRTPIELNAVRAAIRLANVLQWRQDFATAHRLIHQSMATIDAVPIANEHALYARYLLPYVYLHSARCYFDEGNFVAALGRARACLQLRHAANVPASEINRTVDFIVATRNRLGMSAPDDASNIDDTTHSDDPHTPGT